MAGEGLRGQAAGTLAQLVPAHAVGHNEQAEVGQGAVGLLQPGERDERILVGRAYTADVVADAHVEDRRSARERRRLLGPGGVGGWGWSVGRQGGSLGWFRHWLRARRSC